MKKRTFRMLLIIAIFIGVLSVAVNATDDPEQADGGIIEDMEFEDGLFGPRQAIITIPSVNEQTGANFNLDVIVVEGSESKYLLTNENGKAIYTGASADNYNIMFSFLANGVPTVTLKDAKLINGQGNALTIGRVDALSVEMITDFPCKIIVETDSVISGTYNTPGQPGTYSGIVCQNEHTLTISGPGKLSVSSEGMYAIWMDGYDLILRDANVSAASTIAMSAGVRPAIWVKNADILIDHSTVEVSTNSGPGIWISDSVSGISEQSHEWYNIVIQNGSNVKVFNPNSKLAAIGCKEDIFISDSVVEVIAKAKCFAYAPIFVNVGTVAGADRLTAEAYDPEKNDTYAYFLSTVDIMTPSEEGGGTEETPDATEIPSTGETGAPEPESTEETISETIEESASATTETAAPITFPEETTSQTAPVEPAPSEKNRNSSWIIFAAVGVAAVAAGVIWWFVIRKKIRR